MTNHETRMTVDFGRAPKLRSFPGSAWEHTAPEALPQRTVETCKTVRYEAEPGNDANWEVLSLGISSSVI